MDTIKCLSNKETNGNPTLDYYDNLFYTGQSMLFYSNDYNFFINYIYD